MTNLILKIRKEMQTNDQTLQEYAQDFLKNYALDKEIIKLELASNKAKVMPVGPNISGLSQSASMLRVGQNPAGLYSLNDGLNIQRTYDRMYPVRTEHTGFGDDVMNSSMAPFNDGHNMIESQNQSMVNMLEPMQIDVNAAKIDHSQSSKKKHTLFDALKERKATLNERPRLF